MDATFLWEFTDRQKNKQIYGKYQNFKMHQILDVVVFFISRPDVLKKFIAE